MFRRLLCCAWCLSAFAARAGDLNPEAVAKIHADEEKAMDKVNSAHGNKKSSEMDSDERKQVIEEQRAAKKEVLEKNGVSDKAYERYEAKMSLSEREEQKAAAKTLKDKEEADKKAAAAGKPADTTAPTVQHGFSDKKPVEMESKGGAPKDGQVVVEKGTPKDDAEPAAQPAAKRSGKGKHKR